MSDVKTKNNKGKKTDKMSEGSSSAENKTPTKNKTNDNKKPEKKLKVVIPKAKTAPVHPDWESDIDAEASLIKATAEKTAKVKPVPIDDENTEPDLSSLELKPIKAPLPKTPPPKPAKPKEEKIAEAIQNKKKQASSTQKKAQAILNQAMETPEEQREKYEINLLLNAQKAIAAAPEDKKPEIYVKIIEHVRSKGIDVHPSLIGEYSKEKEELINKMANSIRAKMDLQNKKTTAAQKAQLTEKAKKEAERLIKKKTAGRSAAMQRNIPPMGAAAGHMAGAMPQMNPAMSMQMQQMNPMAAAMMNPAVMQLAMMIASNPAAFQAAMQQQGIPVGTTAAAPPPPAANMQMTAGSAQIAGSAQQPAIPQPKAPSPPTPPPPQQKLDPVALSLANKLTTPQRKTLIAAYKSLKTTKPAQKPIIYKILISALERAGVKVDEAIYGVYTPQKEEIIKNMVDIIMLHSRQRSADMQQQQQQGTVPPPPPPQQPAAVATTATPAAAASTSTTTSPTPPPAAATAATSAASGNIADTTTQTTPPPRKSSKISSLLSEMVKKGASDLYITFGSPPRFRVNGKIQPSDDELISDSDIDLILDEILSDEQRQEFDKTMELNTAINGANKSRFRINAYRQQQHNALVIRNIPTEIPTIESLGLPDVYKELIMKKRGLILVVGPTGSGKSTSIASMIEYRNMNSSSHIITIEDPIEFVHEHKQSIVSQRDIGIDTISFDAALKNALRQQPDVIAIGEIRDREAMEHALNFAETGHLCIATLHANNSNQTLERILSFFPEEFHNQVRLNLSLNLRGILSQRLVTTVDGKRTIALEIMLNEGLIRDLIVENDMHKIKKIMENNENTGMCTFDQSLLKLLDEGKITEEVAKQNADNPADLSLQIATSKNLTKKKAGISPLTSSAKKLKAKDDSDF